MSSEPAALILIIDDTEATRYSVRRTLQKDGYRVIEAGTGFDGLRMAREAQPDLIILDIHLPDINGFEVCRRMKADAVLKQTPVLQISASYITSKDRIMGLEGGADSYLTHPVEPPVLIATVKSLLRFRSLNDLLKSRTEGLDLAVEVAGLGTIDYFPARNQGTISSRGREMLGFSPDEKWSLRELLKRAAPGDRKNLQQSARLLLRTTTDQVVAIEFQTRPINGQVHWIRARIRASPEAGRADKPVQRIVASFLDVTDQKTAGVEIESARLQAEAANKAKSQFLANMSHEIRTPLGIIMGFTELMMDDEEMPSSESRDFLRLIKKNSLILSKLIEEVLDLSKVEADRMTTEKIQFSLSAHLQDAVGMLSHKAREKGIEIDLLFDGPIPQTIESDPTKLQQILMNLLGNAIKFTESGRIQLFVRVAGSPRCGDPVEIEIEIHDTGVGITHEGAAKLFEPFMQADSSTTRKFGGSGLGLMLSRKLARLMGGDLVLAHSEWQVGSVFRLRLPGGPLRADLAEPALERGPSAVPRRLFAQAPDKGLLKGMRILLVDDSMDNQILIESFLQSEGAVTSLANNGQEGVEKALATPFDAVLMDIQMPILDGYQATQILLSQGFQSPIVAVTAHAMKSERERCLQLGFSEYLTKPIHRSALVQTLQSLRELDTRSVKSAQGEKP